ncbi:MAG TPA: NADP-dependent oxidoreductase [Polyangiaceae bacterium]|nr:NADP-dependent oxidoreductase [Polyangiaceae bacterium]
MRAIVLTAYGDVKQLEFKKLPRIKPGPNEIKVRMAGAGINPVDWKLRSGALQDFMPLALPAILGRDVSGEVAEIGPGVTQFQVGDKVMGLVMGGYATFVVAACDAWAIVPPGMDLVDAAALPLALLTGAQLIEEALKPRPNDVVLVTGALGSVGRVAVYAAKLRGDKVWAGVRGARKHEAAALGVDGVVALDSDSEIEALPLLDGVADTVGGATTTQLLGKIKPGGSIASIVGEPAGAKERGLDVRLLLTHPDAARLAALAKVVAEGTLVLPIVMRMSLPRAAEAQSLAEHHAGGKVLLTGRPKTWSALERSAMST